MVSKFIKNLEIIVITNYLKICLPILCFASLSSLTLTSFKFIFKNVSVSELSEAKWCITSLGLPYLKNKKGLKINAIVDNKRKPLFIDVSTSTDHDSKQFHVIFNDFKKNKKIKECIKNNPNEFYFLADKGYDTKAIISTLKNNKLKPIIPYNKKNTKDSTKIRTYTDEELEIYKNRIKVENFFANIKKYPKINHVYEKTKDSYTNMVLFIASFIILKG